ncbi:hypothetical protein ACFSJU_08080 [Paradesertivirga mongoliensis]|uniref:Uncharacterized protein n=1 Tax=Paradesertivirga mongoliensis TaxID=2100740 RepID=A0ABW4ZJV3_9SPHI|nr:hypothetical protein [Pedobacter mongoliensis]
MKVINLPRAYLKEQLCIKVNNLFLENVADYHYRIVVLPRSLSIIKKRMIGHPIIQRAIMLRLAGKEPLHPY